MSNTILKPLPAFIVVVHATDAEQCLAESRKALAAGAGGVMLISHDPANNTGDLLRWFKETRQALPEAWIGLNLLGVGPTRAVMDRPAGCDAMWLDFANVHSQMPDDAARVTQKAAYAGAAWHASFIGNGVADGNWHVMASVAFKYQKFEPHPDLAAVRAAELFSVVVTSGAATGSAADVDKVRKMRDAMDAHGLENPLALASGVTAENVREYLPFVQIFMVATGVSTAGDVLDPAKIRELADIIATHPKP